MGRRRSFALGHQAVEEFYDRLIAKADDLERRSRTAPNLSTKVTMTVEAEAFRQAAAELADAVRVEQEKPDTKLPSLSPAQEAAVDDLVAYAHSHGATSLHRRDLAIRSAPESEPGAGGEIHVHGSTAESVIYSRIDVHGHGTASIGSIDWLCVGDDRQDVLCRTCAAS